jgi:hypothetical protein
MKWYVNILEETVIQVAQLLLCYARFILKLYGDHRASFEILYLS